MIFSFFLGIFYLCVIFFLCTSTICFIKSKLSNVVVKSEVEKPSTEKDKHEKEKVVYYIVEKASHKPNQPIKKINFEED